MMIGTVVVVHAGVAAAGADIASAAVVDVTICIMNAVAIIAVVATFVATGAAAVTDIAAAASIVYCYSCCCCSC